MCTCDGFTFTEILISLFIVASSSLAMIQQQWHLAQVTHQIDRRDSVTIQLNNVSEQAIAHRKNKAMGK